MKTTDKTANENQIAKRDMKRDSIKALAAATVVGGIWAKPVVKGIVLPVHAMMTTPVDIPCPDVTIELVETPVNSGNACLYNFVALSTDMAVPVTITAITSPGAGNNLGVSSTDPLPAEATNASGVAFTVQAIRFPDDGNTCILAPDGSFDILIDFTCDEGSPRQMSFPLQDFVPTLVEQL